MHEVTLARFITAEASPEEEESGAHGVVLASSSSGALGWPMDSADGKWLASIFFSGKLSNASPSYHSASLHGLFRHAVM